MTDQEQKPKRKRLANPDRITLSKTATESLQKLESQVEKAFGGMVRLKNKELTNFILEARISEFTNNELKLIKERYFDEVRAASWALQKLKEAKERGEELKLSALLAQLQTPFVKEKSKAKIIDKKRLPSEGQPATSSPAALNGGSSAALSGPAKPRPSS